MKIETGTRRGFLIGALALMTAPAIVRADSLMKVTPIDVYDTRCLIDYEISMDRWLLRVDRSLTRLVRPRVTRNGMGQEVDIETAKNLFGKHWIFDAQTFNRDANMDQRVWMTRQLTYAQVQGITNQQIAGAARYA